MIWKSTLLMLILSVVGPGVAVVSGDEYDKAQEQMDRLEGLWEVHMTEEVTLQLEIQDGKIELFVMNDLQRLRQWTADLVISKKHPSKHFDWKNRMSANGSLPDNQCLYRLTGDTLLIIGGGPNRRPTKFISGQGEAPKTIICTRVYEASS